MSPGPSGRRPRLAAAVAVTSWGLAVLSLALMAHVRPPLDENVWFYLVDVVVACVHGTVAALVLSRRSHPVGWIVALTAIGGGLAALAFVGEAWWLQLHPDAVRDDLPTWLDRGNSTAWVPGTMSLFLVVPWLVRDHPLGPGARLGLGAGVLVAATMTLGGALGLDPLVGIGIVVSVPLGLLTAAAVELRHRRGPVAERNGLGWLALGTLVMAVSFVPLLLPTGDNVGVWVTPVLHLVSQALFPAAILVAVLRGRMWDLDLAVSRATVAAIMAVALLALYVAVVVAVSTVVPGEGVAQAVGAGAVALAVQPVRMWAQTRTRRLVHGLAADPALAVRRLGAELGRGDDDLLPGLARGLAEAVRLESVRVLDEEGRTELARWEERPVPAAAAGSGPGTESLVLEHRGVVVGHLVVTVPGGETIAARDRQVLADLANLLAAAVAVVRGAEEVARLRDDLAHARLAERRLIRREIHDGLGPSLAGLRLGVQGVQNLLAHDPEAAARLLESLGAELAERTEAVRELSHHLLPPVLDELGLGPALEELAARHRTDHLRVEVRVDPVDPVPAPVAAAAYGIAVEALTNARRHAAAHVCRVRLEEAAGRVRLEVRDDGRGITADDQPGVGTASMRERAEEVGGVVTVRTAPDGGTVVEAVLPLRSREARTNEVAGV